MSENKRNIRHEIDTKLNDPVLRGALARFAEQYPGARLKAYANVEDVDGLRNSFKAMKAEAVEHIEEIADKFEASVKARGAHFFRAKDGAALKEYLNKVCQENNVKRIIKSKSMATEEIHLNEYLKDKGYHVMETDMGEWIISIAGHKPSHMVMPAIHLSKEQCAEYFTKELGRKIEPVIYDMIQTARKNLRSEFILPLTLVECYPIGVIRMVDQGKNDEKIIAVACNDPVYSSYKDITELPNHIGQEIRHFFQVYKMLEKKDTIVYESENREEAEHIIDECIKRYRASFGD